MQIRRIREGQGLTQQALAELVGLKRVSITRYETGCRSPSLEIAAKIAEVLGCTVDDLIRAEDDEPASKEV